MLNPSTCSPDTLKLWQAFPQLVQDQDTANGYPWLTWLEGSGSILQTIDDLARDDASGNPGWSILLDVNRCPTAYLPWLAQCVGVRFTSTQISDAQQRAAIRTPTGFARGTPAAIIAAAAPFLASGFSVKLIERTPDPYSYTVQVPVAGLTGGTYGQLAVLYATYTALAAAFATYGAIAAQSAGIIAALQAANPVGLVQTITFV